MAQALPSFPSFDIHNDPASLSQRWTKYIKRFQNLVIAMDISDKIRQRHLLLHYAGEDVNDILDTLTDTGTDIDGAVLKLNEYFNPKKNLAYETTIFRNTMQNQGETLDAYVTRLRQVAVNCEFHDISREIKQQIIQGGSSASLRRRILRESEITLTAILDLARSLEQSELQAKGIENNTGQIQQEETVHMVKNRKQFNQRTQKSRNNYQSNSTKTEHHHKNNSKPPVSDSMCGYCGYARHKSGQKCPAKGNECNYCHKLHHFASVCRKKLHKQVNSHETVKQIQTAPQKSESYSSSDDEYVFGVTDNKSTFNKQPVTIVTINEKSISAIIDTGATVNTISESTLHTFDPVPPMINRNLPKIYGYNATQPLDILGKFSAKVQINSKICETEFFVTSGVCDTLLSYKTCVELGLLHITQNTTQSQVVDSSNPVSSNSNIISEFNDRFIGIGKLKGVQAKLHIDESVQPVAQPHRRLPFHLRERTSAELNRLLELDVIERVDDTPTPWVSPIRVVEKPKNPSEIRICVDMRAPNKAIQRERHITPTIDDIVAELNGSSVYSKLDLNAGYHQVLLAPDSRYMTTFSTHDGLFRYKRLNFGVCSAAEVFQNLIQQSLQGLQGVLNVSDDILVHGRNTEEHNSRLRAVLTRLRERNLTLNRDKCEFEKSRIEFYGYVFSGNGISPDPRKVDAIHNADRPQTVTEVKSFLGMVQYCARFIPDLATLSKPLRDLTKQDIEFEWTQTQDKAFSSIKAALTSDSAMAYFDPSKQTELIVDASPVGLGAILIQKDEKHGNKIISFSSRSLTPVEQRYSQTEREALALTWGILHNHLYLYGNTFTAVTDHKPLVPLFTKPLSRPPTRIERWILKLQSYSYELIYRPGANNPADFISRHPQVTTSLCSREEKLAEEHINFISTNSVPKALTLDEIKTATLSDPTLLKVIELIKTNKWKNAYKSTDKTMSKQLQSFAAIHNELSVCQNDSIILRDSRIVIPFSLQRRVCVLAHQGHQGIVKTKKLLRQKVWFPGIDSLVQTLVDNCIPCQATTPENSSRREPLKMTPLPQAPWDNVCADFVGPLPSGDYLLVVYDEYSRYPEVERVSSTSSKATIPAFDKIFSTHGIPSVLKTDNGPPFNGADFRQFLDYLGTTHRKITPYWPRANGDAERFIKTLQKAMRASEAENKPWKQELYKFLRSYRATPHSSTDKPPAELLFNRPFRTNLPQLTKSTVSPNVEVKDHDSKQKMKRNADLQARAKPANIKIGDTVLLRNQQKGKLCPPFNPNPYTVTAVKGSMVTSQRGNHVTTRNSSFIKVLKHHDLRSDSNEEDGDNDDILYDDPSHTDTPREERRFPNRNRQPPIRLSDYVTS